MKLTFVGGAETVTGANYLLESGDTRILIDCGLNQGGSFCEEANFKPFPYNPQEIDAVFVTHAHIDHTGRLPKLVKDGFLGPVYSTPPTKDFAELLLLDSEHILSEEAAEHDEPPLYHIEDIAKLSALWKGVPYHEPVAVGPFSIEFVNAGHVLGSSCIIVSAEGKRIAFSGDLGNNPAPFITATEYIEQADYALIESAYGNRVHENPEGRRTELAHDIEETIKKRGTLVIPAFALERTQEMLYELNELIEKHEIPKVPVFVDSPLAIKLTAVYQRYSSDPAYFNETALGLIRGGDAIFDFPGLTMCLTTEESKAINATPSPKVIIAGAGMSQGGRIIHHEKRYLPDASSTILFIGYQASNSLGRRILEHEKMVKIEGEDVPVRAAVHAISGYSAHADRPQLLAWLRPMAKSLKEVFVVQGDVDQAQPFAEAAGSELGLKARVPHAGETVVL